MIRRPSPFQATCIAVLAAQAGLGGAIMLFGPPGPIAVHFDADWVADRWETREAVGRVALFIAAGTAMAVAAVEPLSRRVAVTANGRRRTASAAQTVLLILGGSLSVLFAAMAFGAAALGARLLLAGMCLMLALIGGYLGKVSPNALVGVRTPWTLSSRLAWDKANRLAGRLFFWGGLLGAAAAPFLPEPQGFRIIPFGAIVIAGVATFESWRVWRSDPDRTSVL